MPFRTRHAPETIKVRASDLLDRIHRIEAEQSAPVIGSAIENFAQAMRAPLPRGRSGDLVRARTMLGGKTGSFKTSSNSQKSTST